MSKKITQLESATDVTASDFIQIVDVEDSDMAPSGTNKKATAGLLANQLVPLINAGAIAGSKIADSGITSAKIANDTIVNADINSSAAIAGTKISPDFGSQNIITTGTLSANVGSIISGSSSGDALTITQTGTGNALVVEDSANPDSTPFVVNNSGCVISGFDKKPSGNFYYSPSVLGDGAKTYTISAHSTLNVSSAVIRYSDNTTSPNFTANLILAKSNTQTIDDHVAVLDDQPIGEIGYFGSDGANFIQGCSILSKVDGAVSANSVPMCLIFSTRPAGSVSNVSEAMRITSAGNIGIGVISPAYRLQLSTDSAAKPSTSTWTVSSDERLKENIEAADLDICYNAVKSIPLKRYKWKDEIYSAEQVADRSKIGWIAQDVQAVFPKAVGQHKFVYNQVKDEEGNIVSEDSIDDCLSLNSDQLYAALFGAVQKLMGEVESLQDRIAELESAP